VTLLAGGCLPVGERTLGHHPFDLAHAEPGIFRCLRNGQGRTLWSTQFRHGKPPISGRACARLIQLKAWFTAGPAATSKPRSCNVPRSATWWLEATSGQYARSGFWRQVKVFAQVASSVFHLSSLSAWRARIEAPLAMCIATTGSQEFLGSFLGGLPGGDANARARANAHSPGDARGLEILQDFVGDNPREWDIGCNSRD
jgi:hypothetical protein